MNDQPPATIMNQQPPQLMSQPPPIPVMNPVQPPPPPISIQSQMLSHSQAMNQPQPLMMMNQRPYKKFQNQQQNPLKYNNNFVPSKPRSSSNNNNWKGKNVNNNKRMENSNNNPALSGGGGYKPPSLNDLQTQNRMKARKYYHPKKKFNNRFAPYAPRNTTSFIIRAKKSGGIASLVSPCPVTPAVLPTPIFSPSREVLGDMAKEEWGVDGYGSMKGLIRFEMIYPSGGGGEYSYNNVLENRVDDQDTHIAQLEEENLTLKERLFLMERELGDLRRRLQFLERQQHHHHGQSSSAMVVEDVNEEVVENVSENDENENESDGVSDIGGNTGGDGNEEVMEYVGGNGERRNVGDGGKEESNDVCMEENVPDDHLIVKHKVKDEKATSGYVGDDEVVGNDEVIIKENEVKGGERGDWFVPTDAETGKDDGAKDEERGIEVLLDRLVAKEEEEPVQGDLKLVSLKSSPSEIPEYLINTLQFENAGRFGCRVALGTLLISAKLLPVMPTTIAANRGLWSSNCWSDNQWPKLESNCSSILCSGQFAISLCPANAVIDLNTGCYRGYVFSDTSISIPGDEVYENMTLWFIVDAIPLVESRQNSFSCYVGDVETGSMSTGHVIAAGDKAMCHACNNALWVWVLPLAHTLLSLS
ncbi:hypothetical protein POTOM_012895 [Populus tomentosa]|uniref:Uncharacterized protein n=1 Tax=Populus tomentosa TaxID=118781 RepID=A0A8X8ABA5_POPTO|nr:hypothetical protein POTOM_012895 [Populus tomentosa]